MKRKLIRWMLAFFLVLTAMMLCFVADAGPKSGVSRFLRLKATARGERFYPGKRWADNGQAVFDIATREGLSGWGRRVWMMIVYNESRLNPGVRGDQGCAYGLGQVHVGAYLEAAKY